MDQTLMVTEAPINKDAIDLEGRLESLSEGAFDDVLMEEGKQLDEGEDDEDNSTVVHVAIGSSIQNQILSWALEHNSKHIPLLSVHTNNVTELTTLDLHWAIALPLCQAGGGRRGQSSHSQSLPMSIMQRNQLFSHSSVFLIALILIATSAYSSIFKINGTYVGIKALRVGDMILHPDLLPKLFYSIVFITAIFTVSMVGVVVPFWSVIKDRSFFFQALQLLGLGAFFLSYAFMVKEKVPKFCVTTESFTISSFWLVWLYIQPFILILAIIWLVAKRIIM